MGSMGAGYLRWALQVVVVLFVGPFLTSLVWPSAPLWAFILIVIVAWLVVGWVVERLLGPAPGRLR
jgi:hypothetical protein